MTEIPELTEAQLARALPARTRRRLMLGRFESGEDVSALRRFVGLSQAKFAKAMGISVHTLRNWEQDRRKPEGPAVALLRIVARHPHVIHEVSRSRPPLRSHHELTSPLSGEQLAERPTKPILERDKLKPMERNRLVESILRALIESFPSLESSDPEQLADRFGQLYRNLAPEDEFSLILSWLGRCKLVHKLSQEQLPISSPDFYRVPDLLAVFDYRGTPLPALIEVKRTTPGGNPLDGTLKKIKRGYLAYAEALGLPILIAWKHGTFWTLFEMQHASPADSNMKIDFDTALKENLLMLLAGDLSYQVVPGTAVNLRIEKLTEPNEDGRFEGVIKDAFFTNPVGDRIPNIPHLMHLLLTVQDEVKIVDEGTTFLQKFTIKESHLSEFASRTLGLMLSALHGIQDESIDWRSIVHNKKHWVHQDEGAHNLFDAAADYGVVANTRRFLPKHIPAFLQEATHTSEPSS